MSKMQCTACGWIGTFDELEDAMGYDTMCPVCGESSQEGCGCLFQEYKWQIRTFYRLKARIFEYIGFKIRVIKYDVQCLWWRMTNV